MSIIWQKNLQALQHRYPDLYVQFAGGGIQPAGDLVTSADGRANLRLPTSDGAVLYAYDEQDPWQDASVYLPNVPVDFRGLALFVGIGLGYGPLRILRERLRLRKLVVVEPCLDLFAAALAHVDLAELILADTVRLFVGEFDAEAFTETVEPVAIYEDTHILRHLASFQWRSDYGRLNEKVFMIVNQFNLSGSTTRKCGEIFFGNRAENLALLAHSCSVAALKNKFAGRPAVLVAAGPSLDRSIEDVRRVMGRAVLFAVDSAVVPLVENGIVPDFVTSLDFQELNFEKFGPLVSQHWDFSLVTTPRITPLIPKRVKARHNFIAFDGDIVHHWVTEALGVTDLVPSCFSVAHLSLGLALLMGCDPIIFVGQDLGYTVDDADHAAGTVIMADGPPKDQEIFHTAGVNGTTVRSDRGLMGLLKRFEDIIIDNACKSTFINATVAGARIAGTEEMALAAATEKYMTEVFPVRGIIDHAANQAGFPVAKFVKAGRRNTGECRRLLRRLDDAQRLGKTALTALARVQRQRPETSGFDSLPPQLRRTLSRFDAVNNEIDRAVWLGAHVLELTYGDVNVNDRSCVDNQRLLAEEGYLSWLLASIERVTEVNRVRRKAFMLYAERIEGLCGFLEQEARLLKELREHEGAGAALALARLHADRQHYRVVEPLALAEVSASPDVAEAWMLVGEARAAVFAFEAAEEAWQKALWLDADLASRLSNIRHREQLPWLTLIELYANFGTKWDNFPHLLPVWLARITALQVNDVVCPQLNAVWGTHRQKAQEWLAAGETAKALQVLNRWQSVAGGLDGMDHLVLAVALAMDDHETALVILDRLASAATLSSEHAGMYARLLLENGRFEEGIVRLDEAVAMDPTAAGLWEELGDLLQQQGDDQGAGLCYERCLHASPNRVDLLRKIGHCYGRSVPMTAVR